MLNDEIPYRPLTIENQLIHDGLLYRNALKMDILDAGLHYVLIKTGSKIPHVILGAVADGDTQILISESPTLTNNGTLEPTGGFNFNIPVNNTMALYDTPAVTDSGVYVGNTWIFAGHGVTTPSSAGVSSGIKPTIIEFKPNTDYLLTFINSADRNIQVFMEVDFFEK